ncbi:hypothetical protein BU24DRAFT_423595 [Aaosphaeria arxii CBS 175.79]|uniref:Spherulation-specific family 4 n=1 Tax=Aaosphaeria arxii CBS 175.79 TaxID=1450172 RepID=A0A6A5XN43_9PLEO|nr:uncharacterized protein BU24DRAFT_423595 [Aaosphaeria arxii CBS 175.79]KAF2014695.1 hypothetical protein BU24DRAFT_423595 [Aaosphaeria arxii CBS 175.79]
MPPANSANTNPNLNFTVIVNPCSGPCINRTIEAPYITELPRLREYKNIRTLGYVATNYTNKPIDLVLQEIDTYANWSAVLGGDAFHVDGIFFDETPGPYHWRSHEYLSAATAEVKKSEGLGQKIVVHNPGAIPYIPWNYLDIADITVVFEETFAKFIDAPNFNAIRDLPANSNLTKSHFAVMLHSVPNIPDELLAWVAAQLKTNVGWAFVSSVGQPGEYWHSFSSVFGAFIGHFAKA